MRADERDALEARRRRLVGSAMATGAPSESVEASFPTRFGRFFREQTFWRAFRDACDAAHGNAPWHQHRQLMLSYSLPQEINAKDDYGETMLTLAATFGRVSVVNVLCQVKGDPHVANAKGWSSVHIAAAYGHTALLHVFLTLGVSVNEPERQLGYTPLHLAAAADNVAVLECLHAAKQGDFMKTANNGATLLHVAASSGSVRCVSFLTTHYPDLKYACDRVLHESAVHKAAKSLQPQIYKHLAARGARTDLENCEDDSATDLISMNERYTY